MRWEITNKFQSGAFPSPQVRYVVRLLQRDALLHSAVRGVRRRSTCCEDVVESSHAHWVPHDEFISYNGIYFEFSQWNTPTLRACAARGSRSYWLVWRDIQRTSARDFAIENRVSLGRIDLITGVQYDGMRECLPVKPVASFCFFTNADLALSACALLSRFHCRMIMFSYQFMVDIRPVCFRIHSSKIHEIITVYRLCNDYNQGHVWAEATATFIQVGCQQLFNRGGW